MNVIKQRRSAQYMLILIAITFGSFLRISYTAKSSFPINDGGLFWAMTDDLVQNHFVIPPFTTYNNDHLPFAYPPGAFYVLGFLNQYLHIPQLDLFRFFPLVCSILELLLIYPIARFVLTSDLQALLATFAFSMIQPAYTWALMGGGVTRSPALFFSMLAVLGTLGFVKGQKKTAWAVCSLLSIVLTAYFHMEIAWVTAVIMAFLALSYERSRRVFAFLGAHLIGGVILLAPYWGKILEYHGIGPFRQAFSMGYSEPLASLGILFIPLFTEEKIFQVLAVLAALGVYACIATRQDRPVAWLILIPLIDPRSMHRAAALPEALLIAASLDVFIIQGLGKVLESSGGGARSAYAALAASAGQDGRASAYRASFPYLLTGGILIYAFLLSSLQQITDPQAVSLSANERSAFAWVETHTAPDAAFFILPASSFWEGDWVSEWFPALTNRRSVLTVQGYEWVANRYREKIATYRELGDCLAAKQPCYAAWQAKYRPSFDYLLVQKRSENYSPITLAQQGLLKGCTLDYQNPDVELYRCD